MVFSFLRPFQTPFTSTQQPTPPHPTSTSSSSATSLEFDDTAPCLSERATTVTFPPNYPDYIHSETNGNWVAQMPHMFSLPMRSAKAFKKTSRAAPETLSLANMIETVGVPVGYVVKTGERIVGQVQEAFERGMPSENTTTYWNETDHQRARVRFVSEMGAVLRQSLVSEGIAHRTCLEPSTEDAMWQHRLTQTLIDALGGLDVGADMINSLTVEPIWVPDRKRRGWRLRLKTVSRKADLDFVRMANGDVAALPLEQSTEFLFPQEGAVMSVEDYLRGTESVEDEWELVDDT
ncbi:hypothetical protein P280DRAFT_530864 [Massarina eburnea CBS 473.64]|uniref:Uncharacterized protein n=1 Tax=Massarina eburnea CBS 473.64 TaxID=1395130 RepID=A0A6A6RPW1_9PLEO|nr:hypothetical protein P280DRAFT_530864 [Massarina eburnea CBS 473.64]